MKHFSIKLALISALLFVNTIIYAQSPFSEYHLRVAYFGEFITHPGFKLGVETPFSVRLKEKKRITKEKSKLLAASVGMYHHVDNHYGTFLLTEVGGKGTRPKGFTTERWMGIGYFRSWLASPTFEVDDNGEVDQLTGAGRNRVMLSFAYGIGWDLSRHGLPLRWNLKPTLFLEIPYNNTIMPRVAWEMGVSYRIK